MKIPCDQTLNFLCRKHWRKPYIRFYHGFEAHYSLFLEVEPAIFYWFSTEPLIYVISAKLMFINETSICQESHRSAYISHTAVKYPLPIPSHSLIDILPPVLPYLLNPFIQSAPSQQSLQLERAERLRVARHLQQSLVIIIIGAIIGKSL